jgi:hypothetical protein
MKYYRARSVDGAANNRWWTAKANGGRSFVANGRHGLVANGGR